MDFLNEITINTSKISLPPDYQQVDSMPEDPEGSVPLMAQSNNAMCFVLIREIDGQEAMPFDNPQSVIDDIHECLGNEQGLIEVNSGGQDGERWIYSIVKTLKNPEMPEGVQYTLTLDKECGSSVVYAQGFFDEAGTTGLRDTMVFQMLASAKGFDEAKADWTEDPYDSSFERGALMNQSECAEFDETFPSHPLSMAREFAYCVTSDVENAQDTKEAETALARIEEPTFLISKRTM